MSLSSSDEEITDSEEDISDSDSDGVYKGGIGPLSNGDDKGIDSGGKDMIDDGDIDSGGIISDSSDDEGNNSKGSNDSNEWVNLSEVDSEDNAGSEGELSEETEEVHNGGGGSGDMDPGSNHSVERGVSLSRSSILNSSMALSEKGSYHFISDIKVVDGDSSGSGDIKHGSSLSRSSILNSSIGSSEKGSYHFISDIAGNQMNSDETDKKRPSKAAAAPASPTKKKKAIVASEDDSDLDDESEKSLSQEEAEGNPVSSVQLEVELDSPPEKKSMFDSDAFSEYSEDMSFSSEGEVHQIKGRVDRSTPAKTPVSIPDSKSQSEVESDQGSEYSEETPPPASPVIQSTTEPEQIASSEKASEPANKPSLDTTKTTESFRLSMSTNTPAAVAATPAAAAPVPASSKSSADQEKKTNMADAPTATKATKKKSFLDDSDSDDSSSSDDSSPKKKSITSPPAPAPPKKKSFFDDSDSDDGSSDDSSSDDSSEERRKKAKAKAPPPKPKVSISDLKQEGMTEEEKRAKVAEAAAGLWDFKRPQELVFDDEPDMSGFADMSDFYVAPPPPLVLADPDLPEEIGSEYDPYAAPPPPALLADPDLPEEIESNLDELIAAEMAKAEAKTSAMAKAAFSTAENAQEKSRENDSSGQTGEAQVNRTPMEAPPSTKKKSFLDDSSSSDDSIPKKKSASSTKKRSAFLDSSSDESISDSSGTSESGARNGVSARVPEPAPIGQRGKANGLDSGSGDISSSSSEGNLPTAEEGKVEEQTGDGDSASEMDVSDDINSVMSDSKTRTNDTNSEIGNSTAYSAIDPSKLHSERTKEANHSVARHHRSIRIDESKANKCAACGQEAEFCPDGLLKCTRCSAATYCTQDCMNWDWERGGHKQICPGATDKERMSDTGADVDITSDPEPRVSIFAFETQSDEHTVAGTQERALGDLPAARAEITAKNALQERCKACGIEKECVPEGMVMCSHCSRVQYCCNDCMSWDWNLGGHNKVCSGATSCPENLDNARNVDHTTSDVSEQSIPPFGDDSDGDNAPQTQDGILAALSAARAQAATPPKEPTIKFDVAPNKCKACSMEKEFVPDGMVMCLGCGQVPYCSDDCRQWDWDSGGHGQACPGASKVENMDKVKPSDSARSDVSEQSIPPFGDDSDEDSAPQTQDGILAALSAARAQAATPPKGPTTNVEVTPNKCKACSMEKEFVPDGMVMCPGCNQVPYCSDDCRQWDWESGGHRQACPGASKVENMDMVKPSDSATSDVSEQSIPPFGDDSDEDNAPQTQDGILAALSAARAQAATPPKEPTTEVDVAQNKCNACSMEKEFVPDGMVMCPGCSQVPYCSDDCRQWDWESGGHRQACPGASKVDSMDMVKPNDSATSDVSEQSIPAFGDDSDEDNAPQTQDGILAALSAARAQAATPQTGPTSNVEVAQNRCKACSMERDFVPDGMVMCPGCNQVPYCSDDCRQWDWDSGGHRQACPGAAKVDNMEKVKPNDSATSDVSEQSIPAFGDDSDDDSAPQTQDGILAALSAARAQAATPQKGPTSNVEVAQNRCKACSMEREFVPDGMVMCPGCSQVPYCSDDCRKWDWESGGHRQACPGASKVENMDMVKPSDSATSDVSEQSIPAFGDDSDEDNAPQTQDGILAALSAARAQAAAPQKGPTSNVEVAQNRCKACSMEKDFVPDGMVMCPGCGQVPYCSDDCRQWDWDSGGHGKACRGATNIENMDKGKPNDSATSDVSEQSIPAFVDDSDEDSAPQTQHGILAALSAARAQVATPDKLPATNVDVASKATPAPADVVPHQNKQVESLTKMSEPRNSLRDMITGGTDPQQERDLYIPSGSTNAIPQTKQSLRDQITGGTDPQTQIQQSSQPVSQGYNVTVLKLELERTKRQYNEAMLSKASLERNLSQGNELNTSSDDLLQAFADFLDRSKGFLLGSGAWPTVENRKHLDEQMNLLRKGRLAKAITEFETTIESFATNYNRVLAEKDTIKKAYEGAEAELKFYRQRNRDSDLRGEDVEKDVTSGLLETVASAISENRSLRDELDRAKRQHEEICTARETSERLLKEKEALVLKLCETIVALEGRATRQDGEKDTLYAELRRTKSYVEELQHAKSSLEKALKESESKIQLFQTTLAGGQKAVNSLTSESILSTEPAVTEVGNSAAHDSRSILQPAKGHLQAQREAATGADYPTMGQMDSIFRSPSTMLAQNLARSDKPATDRMVLSPAEQREDMQDPAGKRLLDNYEGPERLPRSPKPTIFEEPPRVSNPYYGKKVEVPGNGRKKQPASLPTIIGPVKDTHSQRGKSSGGYNDDTKKDRTITKKTNDVGATVRDEITPRDPAAERKTVVELALSPTERRMAYIQQQIADAVQTAKQNPSPSAGRQYVSHGIASSGSKSPLRPRYKEPQTASAKYQEQIPYYKDPKAVDRLAMPSLAPERRQNGGPYPTHNGSRAQLPKYTQPSSRPKIVSAMATPRSLAPGGGQANKTGRRTTSQNGLPHPNHPRQYQRGVGGPPTNTRTFRDPRVGPTLASRREADPKTASPRLYMMEEVNESARATKDARWKNVLQSSRVLS